MREQVREMVDLLPAEDLPTARRVLSGLLASPPLTTDALRARLAEAPLDDESETDEERAAVDQAWRDYHDLDVLRIAPRDSVYKR